MANVQTQFERFHNTIRVDMEASQPLREKRDILVAKIRKHLIENNRPLCTQYGQGSYTMRTGVIPIDGMDYDIDVGLMFTIEEKDYTAKEVRNWVHEAVENHTDDVQDRGPCVRVVYSDGYHVDLVSYARWEAIGVDTFRLAHKENGWRPADPPLLRAMIDEAAKRFAKLTDSATSTDQFRRCVRYLRRWVDLQYPGEPTHKPTGLGLVLLCRAHLSPMASLSGDADDRASLESMLSSSGGQLGRLVAHKPAPEGEDLFARMNDDQMNDFKVRLLALRDKLRKAGQEPDPTAACTLLAGDDAFGEDFPIPPKEETAKRSEAAAIIRSSTSGT